MAQFKQMMIPTEKKILLGKEMISFISEKNRCLRRSNRSVTTEKICQPERTQQVCTEHKWFPCCLIGQLAMANAVKYVQKKAEGDH